MNLNEIRAALRACDRDAKVFVDNLPPATICSWRGDYSKLTFTTKRHRDDYRTEIREYAGGRDYGTGLDAVYIAHDPTVGELLKAIDLAEGEQFEGYKGGAYWSDFRDPIHVVEDKSEVSWNDSIAIVAAVENLGSRVDLLTKAVGW